MIPVFAQLSSPILRIRAGTCKITWDGNSLVAGSGASSGSFFVSSQTSALPPLAGLGIPVTNVAISGQTIRQMNGLDTGNSADVDAAFDASKAINLLIVWEFTNSIFGGRSAAQALQDMADYCAARLAAHPSWKIIIINTLPRFQDSGGGTDQAYINALNSQLLLANAGIKANYRAWGAKGYVDVRPTGGPFDLPDWSLATFERSQTLPLWRSNDVVPFHVHLSNSGYGYVASRVAAVLRNLKS